MYSDLQLQDLDADTSSSRKLDRKKRDVQSEPLAPPQQQQEEEQPKEVADQKAQSRSDSFAEPRSVPSLYALDDATTSQYGTVRQRSARQLRGQTGNQPWPSDYEVIDTPYSSSNNYYNTNKGVSYHNRPAQNVPYIQYAEKSPHVGSSPKAKKSQNSDLLPLLLNGYNLQKHNYHQPKHQQQQNHHHQSQQQQQSHKYLDDEENSLPDNFSYFHLGKGQSNTHSEKKQSQLKYNYVPNTTPKGSHSNSYIAFSTVGGFYNNQPVTQSPKHRLKQQYFTPSDGRWISNNQNSQANSKPSNQQQEESYYSTYQSFPNNDRPVEIGNKPKHTHHYQQQPEKVTPSYNNEDEFYPTHGYNNNNNNKKPGIFSHNYQSPYVDEVEIRPKRPQYESSTPNGQQSFYGTEKPKTVQVLNVNKEKPVYESNESDYNRKPQTSFSATYNAFDEFLAGIRNTNYQDIKPTYMKNLTIPKLHHSTTTTTQRPNNEYYGDDDYYYDEEYEDPLTPQQPQKPPQKPVKQHSSYISDNNNNNQYFYNSQSNTGPASDVAQEPLNNHFKIPIKAPGQILQHTTSKPTTVIRPKPLTTSTVKYPTTTPSYAVLGSSDEYYYDDDDYDYKIPVNASKYMPMSETMAPRPTQPSKAQRPQSPYNKYNIHTSNYHYTAPVQEQSSGGGSGNPAMYDVTTLDHVDDNSDNGNEDEYQIDIRILNSTGTRNQLQGNSVPSILQFPEDYFQGIHLKPQNHSSKHKIKTTELYTKPLHNYQSTYRPASIPTSTMATKIASATVKYTKPSTASSTPAIVTIKQRPTTTPSTTTTVTTTTALPPVPTTRKVYTVRPSRINNGQKWKPSKKNKNKTEQHQELDERLPNR